MKYKLVGFDLDGTIVDSLYDLHDAVNYALSKENLPARTQAEVRSFIGNGVLKLLSRAMSPIEDEVMLAKLKKHFDFYYSEHYCDKTKAYDGIVELFHELVDAGVKLFVFSNKPEEYVHVILEKVFPDIPFVASLGANEKFPVKPNPDKFMHFLSTTDIKLEECAYVGDSDVDVIFSKNANIMSVAVLWGYMSKETISVHNPNYIVDSPAYIAKILL